MLDLKNFAAAINQIAEEKGITPEKVMETIEMAIAAAVDDNRFLPVAQDELPEIKIEISVLSPMQKISDISEIKLGEHGITIKQGLRGGTFLPEVAKHFNYNLEEFLNSLCAHKAGLPTDAWHDPETEIYIFTTQKIEEL